MAEKKSPETPGKRAKPAPAKKLDRKKRKPINKGLTTPAKSKKKNKGGRPKIIINYKILDSSILQMCIGEECASILGISYESLNNTLKRDGNGGFLDYFHKKTGVVKLSLRRRQFKIAESGNVGMNIWLGKQYLNQSEPVPEMVTEQQRQAVNDKRLGQLEKLVKLRDSGAFTSEQIKAMADAI
jgi:hypothetical protein